jgi:hypothetical protein
MKARKDYQPDPDSQCYFERALHASNVLEQLRPIIGDFRMREICTGKWNHRGNYGSVIRTLEETVSICFDNIRKVRGDSGCRLTHSVNHLDLSVPFKDRVNEQLHEIEHALSSQFNFCRVRINWGELPNVRTVDTYYTEVSVDAPYRYSKQIEAELAWVDNKVVGPYSDIEESPDGIHTAYCRYAKMDKHRNWYVHDGFLAWMPHDECIKVKALGDDREKAERAARSSARREVLAAFG